MHFVSSDKGRHQMHRGWIHLQERRSRLGGPEMGVVVVEGGDIG